MKVRINFSDGHYSMQEYTENHAKAGMAYVEISAEDWREYQEHIEAERGWYQWLLGLDNQQFEKDHPSER
jgi:hypothetical protein